MSSTIIGTSAVWHPITLSQSHRHSPPHLNTNHLYKFPSWNSCNRWHHRPTSTTSPRAAFCTSSLSWTFSVTSGIGSSHSMQNTSCIRTAYTFWICSSRRLRTPWMQTVQWTSSMEMERSLWERGGTLNNPLLARTAARLSDGRWHRCHSGTLCTSNSFTRGSFAALGCTALVRAQRVGGMMDRNEKSEKESLARLTEMVS